MAGETRAAVMVGRAREETRSEGARYTGCATQCTARMKVHSGVEGGRSHDGDLAGGPRGTTD